MVGCWLDLLQGPGGSPPGHRPGQAGHLLDLTVGQTDRSDVRILRPAHRSLQLQQSDVVGHLTDPLVQSVLKHEVTRLEVSLGLHHQPVVSVVVNVHHPWKEVK